MNWTGVVLTGGRSTRMGRDKALIEMDGRTMLQRALDLLAPHADDLLVIGDVAAHTDALAHTFADEHAGMGPLGGLATALKHARHELVVVVACDMPGLTDAFIERIQLEMMHQADAIVPEHDGLIEPLAACYHRHCLAPFERCIAQGTLKMSDALEQVRTLHIPIHPGTGKWPVDLFRNINAPGDLEARYGGMKHMKVMLFGMLAEKAGAAAIDVGARSISELRNELLARIAGLDAISYAIAVDRRIVKEDMALMGNEEIAVLPPFAGG